MSQKHTIQCAVLAALMHVKPDYRSPERLDDAARVIADFVIGAIGDENKRLREAAGYGRDCVMESFGYVETTDDQVMADARLQAIDAVLSKIEEPIEAEIGRLSRGIRTIADYLNEARVGDASFVCEALLAGGPYEMKSERPQRQACVEAGQSPAQDSP
jgi:hypothetical protein